MRMDEGVMAVVLGGGVATIIWGLALWWNLHRARSVLEEALRHLKKVHPEQESPVPDRFKRAAERAAEEEEEVEAVQEPE